MDSVWRKTVSLPQYETLQGDIRTDVLVIGGGITGILCAYFLKERGIDCVLLEGDRICHGVTGDTTAKITAQHGIMYAELFQHGGGVDSTEQFLAANQWAVKKYAELCKQIDCDFEEKTAYVYSIDDPKLLDMESFYYGIHKLDEEIVDTPELPFPTVGALRMKNQGQFNPLKFLAAIVKDLKIYEHSFVKELMPNKAVTEQGSVTFQQVIVATRFPIDNKHGLYFMKLYQYRSYVIALEHAAPMEGMYVDAAPGGMSFRSCGDLLLVGGGGHRTGRKGGGWQELRDFARKYYPNATEKYAWAAQDCMPLDKVPYIGPYSSDMPGCYVATGFRKWGMTSAMIAARLLADRIQGIDNPCAGAFMPSRKMFTKQFFINCAETAFDLLTPTKPRCPHMGCALKWNGAEHSWDCPCHGSRFTQTGGLLDNPANGDKKM